MAAALSITPATTPAPPAPAAPRGVEWISVEVAVQRSGLGKRQITRLCGEEWRTRGVARQNGSKWEIREDADPRVARVLFPDAVATDLRHLTDDARKLMFWKKSVLAEWETFCISDQCRGMNKEQADRWFLELLGAGKLAVKLLPMMKAPPTDRTLRNWQRSARQSISQLADGRSTKNQDDPPADDPFFQCIKDLYLTQQKPDAVLCWKMAAFEAQRRGFETRSLPQTYRFIRTIPEGVLNYFRGGPKQFNDKSAPYIPRDYTSLRVNQIWNADHHRFDVMVTHQGKTFRPWLTAIQDIRSRMIVGWQITDGGNTQSILAAMARAVDGHGIPEQVYFDLGRDFASRAIGGVSRKQLFAGKRKDADADMLGVCGMMNIKVVHCQPYHGQSKPIERFFGTMEQFAKSQPTYCGNSPANRPENLASRLKRNAAPELVDFVEYFRLWVDWHNECHEHHGDGMDGKSPATVFDELIIEKRAVDPQIRQLIFWKPVMAKVGRNGVTCNRLVYELTDSRVWMEWQGKELSVRVDPDDANRASIHDPQGRFLCEARSIEKLGWDATQEKVASAIASKKRKERLVKDYHKVRPKLSYSVGEEMQLQQIEENRRLRELQKRHVPTVTVSTPMDGQHLHIHRALGSSEKSINSHEKKIDLLAAANDPDFFPDRVPMQRPMTFAELMAPFEEKQDAAEQERRAAEGDEFGTLGQLFRQRETEGE